jgi:hypothetical protein
MPSPETFAACDLDHGQMLDRLSHNQIPYNLIILILSRTVQKLIKDSLLCSNILWNYYSILDEKCNNITTIK